MANIYALALHGGVPAFAPGDPAAEVPYRDALITALVAGQALLAAGGSALDAVIATVVWLEDCPLFNAGRGSTFTADARHELDAGVMDGRTLAVGAVAGVRTIRNPVLAALEVMRQGRAVLLGADGAEQLARERGLEIVDPSYFSTPQRLAQLHAVQAHARDQAVDDDAGVAGDDAGVAGDADSSQRFGTVGAVALDRDGHLAAATSTGGLTNKLPSRIADTPTVGAGVYANDATCAVSCTGTGESFHPRVRGARRACADGVSERRDCARGGREHHAVAGADRRARRRHRGVAQWADRAAVQLDGHVSRLGARRRRAAGGDLRCVAARRLRSSPLCTRGAALLARCTACGCLRRGAARQNAQRHLAIQALRVRHRDRQIVERAVDQQVRQPVCHAPAGQCEHHAVARVVLGGGLQQHAERTLGCLLESGVLAFVREHRSEHQPELRRVLQRIGHVAFADRDQPLGRVVGAHRALHGLRERRECAFGDRREQLVQAREVMVRRSMRNTGGLRHLAQRQRGDAALG
jgi:beta-aspartyl-peptidase (threonine type)